MHSICKELSVLEQIIDGRTSHPRNLSLSILKYITDDFSYERKIGHGGCGEVYKGILQNRIVAVKKLFSIYNVEDKEFNREVQSMMKVKHPNIVRFIGYCSNTEHELMKREEKYIKVEVRERLLCFEYISNGSLDNHITDELRGLEWHTRYKIIKGICEGLCHLHKEKGIIHMDLKPSNVLLDDHMVPKIGDFGLSRLAEISRTMSNDRLLSLGYCAPEYQYDGRMSVKSDIYSLGVIMIELVTGSKEEPDITNILRRWRHRWKKSVNHTSLGYQQVTKCIELALSCKEVEPNRRPFICDILAALNKIENMDFNDPILDKEINCLEDMLGIEPLELHFLLQPNRQISVLIHLTNDTDEYFAFIFQMANPMHYSIQPDRDVIAPRSQCNVTIVLETQKQAPKRKYCREELCVQSTRVHEGVRPTDITKLMFIGKKGRVVNSVSLTVIFDMPPSTEERTDDFTFALPGDSKIYEISAKASNKPQLNVPKVSMGTSNQYKPADPSYKWRLVSMLKSLRTKLKVSSQGKLQIPNQEKEPPPVPQGPQQPRQVGRVPSEEDVSPGGLGPGPQPQRDFSPMGEACSKMDLVAIHEILVVKHYKDDLVMYENAPSFEKWTQQWRDMLDARKRGDFAFRDKDFKAAIECYTQSLNVGPEMVSRTVCVRRSFCHIMCYQLDAALRDAMQVQLLYPDWPTALYMQAVALSRLGMKNEALGMLYEATELEEKHNNTKEP